MIFMTLVAALPITANAAYSGSSVGGSAAIPEGSTEANLNHDQLVEYLAEYLAYNFDTAEEMLSYELSKGYLYCAHSTAKLYTIYVNKYTGFVYYVNNVTGQILTSNPTNPGYLTSDGFITVQGVDRQVLMSQISVEFFETANSMNTYSYNSYVWAAERTQIKVEPMLGGIRVNYTLGDTTARFLLPGRCTAETFEEYILIPMINAYVEMMEEYCGDARPDEDFSFFDNEDYKDYEYGCINTGTTGLRKYFTATQNVYKAVLKRGTPEYEKLEQLRIDTMQLVNNGYSLKSPQKYIENGNTNMLEKMYDEYPVTREGVSIYVYANPNGLPEEKRSLEKIVKKYCPDFTFSMMFAEEKECGYVDQSAQKPVIRCSLEYTFSDDGSLSVRLPANSITFDESVYTLKSISPLNYFGAGDMETAGYVFYPDGSGTIVEFDDFYNGTKKTALNLAAQVYGKDYCYSKVTGANREQITMPVFGIVNDVKANALTAARYGVDTVTNGYFAILEEGASLAELAFTSGGMTHKFIGAYSLYNPYPSDEYDLSETLSVGSLGKYFIVSESKYTGSYVTRYVMLTDDTVGNMAYGEKAYYASSYVGMANYYRDFLKENGVLEQLELVSEDIPLYIEVLGAMNITAKFLSFPITKTIPLTTFGNVATMYEEISKCEEYIVKKIAEYEELAKNEKDDIQRYQYEKQAARYRELVGEVENIKNINFKLTGFTNGGVVPTYPTKVKWEKVCGGKSGFKSLINKASEESKASGVNFSIYPDFEFSYISKTAWFDGVSYKTDASKMVDNRYASKQEYNSILQSYIVLNNTVVNTGALERLYGKFNSAYSKYNIKTVSVASLGSDLNSNFDEENPIHRETSSQNVAAVLDAMVNKSDYQVMIDKGNAYAVEYATHILNISTDSSHFRFSSYAVPFIGLVYHSYVNYTGTPLNYSGSPDYDLLRAIETGASLYYIVCYQNTSYMKDNDLLSKYYGVDYVQWYDDIVANHKKLDDAIGDLQDYEIVDHAVLKAERVTGSKETAANYVLLENEIVELVEEQLVAAINATLASLKGDPANYDKRVKVAFTDADYDKLAVAFSDALNRTVDEIKSAEFFSTVKAVIAKYEAEYAGAADEANNVLVVFDGFVYESRYSFITDSVATDKNYVFTKYTIDDGSVTMVTYQKGDDVVKFVINYNHYAVTVRLDANTVIELAGFSYERLD